MYTSQSSCMFAQLVEHLTMNRRVAGSNPAYAAAKECTASGKNVPKGNL